MSPAGGFVYQLSMFPSRQNDGAKVGSGQVVGRWTWIRRPTLPYQEQRRFCFVLVVLSWIPHHAGLTRLIFPHIARPGVPRVGRLREKCPRLCCIHQRGQNRQGTVHVRRRFYCRFSTDQVTCQPGQPATTVGTNCCLPQVRRARLVGRQRGVSSLQRHGSSDLGRQILVAARVAPARGRPGAA